MTQSAGKRRRLLLTGASGAFGTKFIHLFSGQLDIIAVRNIHAVQASTQELTIFDAVRGLHQPRFVTEVECDLLDSAKTVAMVKSIIDLTGPKPTSSTRPPIFDFWAQRLTRQCGTNRHLSNGALTWPFQCLLPRRFSIVVGRRPILLLRMRRY